VGAGNNLALVPEVTQHDGAAVDLAATSLLLVEIILP